MTQREKIHELLDIVLDGNGNNARSREKTGMLPTLFFNYSGHVNDIDIYLHSDGWRSGESADRDWTIRLDAPISQNTIDSLRGAVNKALEDTDEVEVLRRDIGRAEEELSRKKDSLKEMKKKLKKKEKKNEAHDK
jgi:hypothetical protein